MHQVATSPSPLKKRRSRRRRYIILGSIGLIVLWIIVSTILGKREKPIPVTTEKAVRKTILQTVSATGKIQPEIEVKISPEVAGGNIELSVGKGQKGEKREPLGEIKNESDKTLLGQNERRINAA